MVFTVDTTKNKIEPKKFNPGPTSGIAKEAKWNYKVNS
jgi:hypothetical protein